ncbi:ribonuclease Z [Bizionia myxarmorum]|uniref:Ribonuclease Z n=1 Tax=Bizionia myxarmorum TaxID=291186 RepID=A0A5D0REC2_9FLAO|nr:ribonuclease Z [Bizionia myxarmorum]TYB79862.1 ribonuclease Z [Bizionia myxarmorum]
MIFDKEENTSIITQEKASVIELVKKLEVLYERFKNDNVIVNLTSLKQASLSDFSEFLQISKKHKQAKNSFVIVSNQANLDETPEELIVVPTLKEAHDIIEMEEMERDLGI